MTEEHKRKLSEALKKAYADGRHSGGAFHKGHKINGFAGKRHTEEWKNKQSEALKNSNPMHKEETVNKRRETLIANGTFAGEKSNNWRGGRPKYRGADWGKQRKLALERDGQACQVCGLKQSDAKKELTVHHIKPYHEGGTNELSNLITVCMSCHFSLEPRRKKDSDA
jgi:hypothetical protein